MATKIDSGMLHAALLGYQIQLEQLNRKIDAIRARLRAPRFPPLPQFRRPGGPPRKHLISAEGRARIAAAQRKRWAEMKKKGLKCGLHPALLLVCGEFLPVFVVPFAAHQREGELLS